MTPARIEGGLVGLLVGDALGVPYEFHDPRNLPPAAALEPEPPAGFRRSHPGTPPGTWSDDGAHALCLLASLLDRDGLDLEDLGLRLRRWWAKGELAVDGRVFDIGIQTSTALGRLEAGVPAERAGPADESANGNGSLMRVLPLALWHRGPDAELAALADRQSLVTHGHPRARLCCAIACLWARRLSEEHPDPWGAAIAGVRELGLHADELHVVLGAGPPRGTGYVVDTLHSARAALAAGPYEAVVKRAIAFGHDTDTTACVAGGLAGVRDGVDAIPGRWRAALRGGALLEPLLARLLDRP